MGRRVDKDDFATPALDLRQDSLNGLATEGEDRGHLDLPAAAPRQHCALRIGIQDDRLPAFDKGLHGQTPGQHGFSHASLLRQNRDHMHGVTIVWCDGVIIVWCYRVTEV